MFQLSPISNSPIELTVISRSEREGDTIKTHYNITIPYNQEESDEATDEPVRPYRLHPNPPLVSPRNTNEAKDEPVKPNRLYPNPPIVSPHKSGLKAISVHYEESNEAKDEPLRPYLLYSNPPIISPRKTNESKLQERPKQTLIEQEGAMHLIPKRSDLNQSIAKKKPEDEKFWDKVGKIATKTFNAIRSPFNRRAFYDEEPNLPVKIPYDMRNLVSQVYRLRNRNTQSFGREDPRLKNGYYDAGTYYENIEGPRREDVPRNRQKYGDVGTDYDNNLYSRFEDPRNKKTYDPTIYHNNRYYHQEDPPKSYSDAGLSNYENVHQDVIGRGKKRLVSYYRREDPQTAETAFDDANPGDDIPHKKKRPHKSYYLPNNPKAADRNNYYNPRDAPQTPEDDEDHENVYRRGVVPGKKKVGKTPSRMTFFQSGPYPGTYYDKSYRTLDTEIRPRKDSFDTLHNYYRRSCNCAGKVAPCKCHEDILRKPL